MNQLRWIRRAAIGGMLVIPLVTAGCGLFTEETSAIDPPQDVVSESDAPTNAGSQVGQPDTAQEVQGEQTRLTVYLQNADGYLAPVSIPVALGQDEQAGEKALALMVEDGEYAAAIPSDFRALLPKGTQINSFTIDPEQKLAKVDFSESFVSYNAQDERPMVEAITWTLTAMSGIEQVELSVQGEKLAEMPVDSFPLDEPLTRSIGINLETASGVTLSQSTPVTLYFSSQTADNEQYYVPVTRLIPRTDAPAEAAMEQLVSGPLNGSPLTAVVTPDFLVKNVEVNEGVATVDFEDSAYQAGDPIPQELLQAVILSVTENTEAKQVQIRLNGDSNIVDENNNSYNQPVERPHHVNALKS
ncbi:GerMN domain-containing protein [Paenibacillus thailandensis]|uniref:GerMN domain-containing protein n=1 Tax=Paenibacillus thailandensis TaxID=393250 RepID=A0ABW5QRV5_9BACL